MPNSAATASMTRKWEALCCVNNVIHDSGNTVTMWNKAKLAKGAKAPITILRPSFSIVDRTGEGCKSLLSNRVEKSGVDTRRKRANSATTLMANAQKNGKRQPHARKSPGDSSVTK